MKEEKMNKEKESAISYFDFKVLTILISLLVVYMVLGTVTSQKIINIGKITVPVVCIWFSLLTFPVTDVICNEFGKKYANFSVLVSWIAMTLTTILANVSAILPAAESFKPYDEVFGYLMTNSSRFFVVVSFAFICSQIIDNELFSFIKKMSDGKYLWIRNNVATIISQIINTLLFVFGMYLGKLTLSNLWDMFLATTLVKIIIALLDTPLVYGGVALIKKIRAKNMK